MSSEKKKEKGLKWDIIIPAIIIGGFFLLLIFSVVSESGMHSHNGGPMHIDKK